MDNNVLKKELDAIFDSYKQCFDSPDDRDYFSYCMHDRINDVFKQSGLMSFYYKLNRQQHRDWFSDEIKEAIQIAAIQRKKPEELLEELEKIRTNFYLMESGSSHP